MHADPCLIHFVTSFIKSRHLDLGCWSSCLKTNYTFKGPIFLVEQQYLPWGTTINSLGQKSDVLALMSKKDRERKLLLKKMRIKFVSDWIQSFLSCIWMLLKLLHMTIYITEQCFPKVKFHVQQSRIWRSHLYRICTWLSKIMFPSERDFSYRMFHLSLVYCIVIYMRLCSRLKMEDPMDFRHKLCLEVDVFLVYCTLSNFLVVSFMELQIGRLQAQPRGWKILWAIGIKIAWNK